MVDVMPAERTRMIFDTDETHRRAVKLYAARHGLSTSDVINKSLKSLVHKELVEAEAIIRIEEREEPGE